MQSLSATYDEAISDYNWFKYTGQRGKEVSERTHKRMIREGDIFGVKSLKSGSRFTLIFPDMPHINFPLDKKNGNQILEKATKLRKLPDIAQREGRAKVRGIKSTERQLQRKNFDNSRFAPRTVPNEYKNGIDFSNYQWRIVSTPLVEVQHTKGKERLTKNEMIGLRYIRDAKGGVLINEKGMYLKLSPENYDKLVAETLVMPIQDWPNGTLTDEDVKRYRVASKKEKQRSQAEMREGARLEIRAEKLAREIAARDAKRSAKENVRAEQERYDEMKDKIKSGEMEAPGPKPRVYDTDEEAIPTVRLRNQVKRILEEETLDEEDDIHEEEEILESELEAEEENEEDDLFAPLGDILTSRPFASDNMGIDSVLGSLFGEGDDSEHVDSDFDLSEVEEEDEPEDEEEQAPPSKVVRKKDKKAAPVDEESDDEESEDDSEEEEEDETDPDAEDDSEDEEEDSEEDESEAEEEEEAEDDGDEEEEDSEEDSEEDDSEEESEDDEEDPDAEESEDDSEEEEEEESEDETDPDVDETSADEETDEDVLNAEQEAAEIAKKKAAENKGTPEKLADPEPGDVVVFKADESQKRKWVVLRESSHKSSDSIIVYTLYDLTNSPDEVRQVRINKARKQSLFDIAEHVEDMKPTLFGRVYDMAEEFEVNREPIVS